MNSPDKPVVARKTIQIRPREGYINFTAEIENSSTERYFSRKTDTR